MRSAVVLFPGSNRDHDMVKALHAVTGSLPTVVWPEIEKAIWFGRSLNATAVIGALATDQLVSFVACAGLGAVVLVLFGMLRGTLCRTPYPAYWW